MGMKAPVLIWHRYQRLMAVGCWTCLGSGGSSLRPHRFVQLPKLDAPRVSILPGRVYWSTENTIESPHAAWTGSHERHPVVCIPQRLNIFHIGHDLCCHKVSEPSALLQATVPLCQPLTLSWPQPVARCPQPVQHAGDVLGLGSGLAAVRYVVGGAEACFTARLACCEHSHEVLAVPWHRPAKRDQRRRPSVTDCS